MSFNAKKCIEYLQDKSLENELREEAADSLICGHAVAETADALFERVMDNSESIHFRNEMAGCLGSVWADIGIVHSQCELLDEAFKEKAMYEYNLCAKKA